MIGSTQKAMGVPWSFACKHGKPYYDLLNSILRWIRYAFGIVMHFFKKMGSVLDRISGENDIIERSEMRGLFGHTILSFSSSHRN
ncbi:hypothetical protein JOD24_002580 [Kroppenstedtia sanguinis]